jgi:hypothetical protein
MQRDRLTASACGPGFEVVHFSGDGDGGRNRGVDNHDPGRRNLGGRVRHRGRCGRGHPQRGDPRTVRHRVLHRPAGADGNGHWLVNSKPAPVRSRNDTRATPTGAAPLSKSTSDRRLGVRDVPAKRVAGGAPITPICIVQLMINRPCEQNGSLRTGLGLPRSLSVIGMLARRVPYRLGAVDNGGAWMGDVVQDRPVMARFPRGLRLEAEKQLSGGAIRRAIGRRAMIPSAKGRPHTLVWGCEGRLWAASASRIPATRRSCSACTSARRRTSCRVASTNRSAGGARMISSSSCRSACGPSSCIIDHRPQPVIQRRQIRQQPLGDRPAVQGPAPPSPPAPTGDPGASAATRPAPTARTAADPADRARPAPMRRAPTAPPRPPGRSRIAAAPSSRCPGRDT